MIEKLTNMPPFIVICGVIIILIVIVQMCLAAHFVPAMLKRFFRNITK